jgi:hypothetical protein
MLSFVILWLLQEVLRDVTKKRLSCEKRKSLKDDRVAADARDRAKRGR